MWNTSPDYPASQAPYTLKVDELGCRHCSTVSKRGARFCSHCGNSLTDAVTSPLACACGVPFKPGNVYCGSCGKKYPPKP